MSIDELLWMPDIFYGLALRHGVLIGSWFKSGQQQQMKSMAATANEVDEDDAPLVPPVLNTGGTAASPLCKEPPHHPWMDEVGTDRSTRAEIKMMAPPRRNPRLLPKWQLATGVPPLTPHQQNKVRRQGKRERRWREGRRPYLGKISYSTALRLSKLKQDRPTQRWLRQRLLKVPGTKMSSRWQEGKDDSKPIKTSDVKLPGGTTSRAGHTDQRARAIFYCVEHGVVRSMAEKCVCIDSSVVGKRCARNTLQRWQRTESRSESQSGWRYTRWTPATVAGAASGAVQSAAGSSRDANMVPLVHKTAKKHDEEQALTTNKADFEGPQKELDAALAYFDKLKPSCVDLAGGL